MSKPRELREQSNEQLEQLLGETQTSLFRLRVKSEAERLENPGEIQRTRREIARIKTVLRLREISQQPATSAPTTSS